MRNKNRIAGTAIVFVLVVSVLFSAATPALAANETATATQTETATVVETAEQDAAGGDEAEGGNEATGEPEATQTCEPAENPSLEQSRLYAPERTIEAGSPGQIAGGFKLDPTTSCPMVVSITMNVPSGMTIEGTSDAFSGGAGIVSTQFTVTAQNGVRDVRAEVYSSNTGERKVTADIKYWPQDHPDRAREIDGLVLTFDVVEPVTPSADSAGGGGGDDSSGLPVDPVVALIAALIGLVALGIVTRSR